MEVLAIDIDGVCGDLHKVWIDAYNADYEDCLTEHDIYQWDMAGFVKEDCDKKIYNYLFDANIICNVPLYPGTYNALAELSKQHHIVLITAMEHPERIRWIRDKLPHIQDAVIAKDKSILKADIIVDDAVHNLDASIAPIKILWTRPWNTAENRFPRVKSWKELVHLLWIIKKREN